MKVAVTMQNHYLKNYSTATGKKILKKPFLRLMPEPGLS